MHVTSDHDFVPEWLDDGTVTRAGHITISDDDHAAMRIIIALVEEDGQTDVHLVYGPTNTAGVDQRSSLVLRGAAGTAFLRLAVRAHRATQRNRKEDDE